MSASAPGRALVRHDAPPCDARILVYQTAAGADYEAMLAATEPLHHLFCRTNRADFVAFRGVRRGTQAWHATLNRIAMIGDLLAEGFDGWFVYLDADAVVRQPRFDLRRYLGKRADAALIAAPGGAEPWNINAGILFLNLGHSAGREIAKRWHAAANRTITDGMLETAVAPWQPLPDGTAFPDDQHLLQMELRADPALLGVVMIEGGGLINLARGRFISQYLRTTGAAAERLAAIRASVDEVMRNEAG